MVVQQISALLVQLSLVIGQATSVQIEQLQLVLVQLLQFKLQIIVQINIVQAGQANHNFICRQSRLTKNIEIYVLMSIT